MSAPVHAAGAASVVDRARSRRSSTSRLGLSISEYAALVHEIVGPALLRAGMVRAKQPQRDSKEKGS